MQTLLNTFPQNNFAIQMKDTEMPSAVSFSVQGLLRRRTQGECASAGCPQWREPPFPEALSGGRHAGSAFRARAGCAAGSPAIRRSMAREMAPRARAAAQLSPRPASPQYGDAGHGQDGCLPPGNPAFLSAQPFFPGESSEGLPGDRKGLLSFPFFPKKRPHIHESDLDNTAIIQADL